MAKSVVRLLGSVEIRDAAGNESSTLPRQPKRLGLLSYLATARPRGFHRRDKLVALFWPEANQEQARHSLSQALHVLRSELGDAAVMGRGDSDVAIDEAAMSCDVVEFELAVEDGEYEKALELYRGDLLDGLFVRDAPEFERWLEDERTRLREKAAGAAWRLAHQHISAGRLVDAERTAQRALLLVTTDESEVRRFIQALANVGDRAAALRFFDKFTRRLRSEYEIEPDPVTVSVAQALAKATVDAHETAEALGEASAAREAILVTPSDGTTPAEPRTFKTPLRQNRNYRIAVAAAAVIIAATAGVLLLNRWSGRALDPNRVLVVALEDESGRQETMALGKMAQAYIIDILTEAGFAIVVDPITTLAVSQNVAAVGMVPGSEEALALADDARAGTVVSGSYYAVGDSVHIQVRITDASEGSVVGTVGPIVGSIAAPSELVGCLGERVVAALAGLFDQELGSWEPAIRPASYEAYKAYGDGLEAYNREEFVEAARNFERAVAADSTFYRAMLWAAQSYVVAVSVSVLDGLLVSQERSDYAKAESLIATLVESREQLSRYESCRLDFVIAWGPQPSISAAYEAARCMAREAPGSDDARVELAFGARRLNRPAECIERLRALRPDRGLTKKLGGQYWVWLSGAYHMLGDYEGELEVVRQGRMGLAAEAGALVALGRLDDAAAIVEARRSLPSQEGLGNWLGDVAEQLKANGHRDAARELFDESIAWFQSQPLDTEASRARLARLLYWAERWDNAERLYEELAEENPENITYLTALGTLAARRGDREVALSISEELRSSRHPVLQRHLTLQRARIAAVLGDQKEAMTLLQQAIDQGAEFGHWPGLHHDIDFELLRDYPPYKEFIRPKG